MSFDVIIVGAGPAGLSTACKLAQLCQDNETSLDICLIEKGSEIGAHILSGAVLETTALNEFFPNWRDMDAPVKTAVTEEEVMLLLNDSSAINVPGFLVPEALNNAENLTPPGTSCSCSPGLQPNKFCMTTQVLLLALPLGIWVEIKREMKKVILKQAMIYTQSTPCLPRAAVGILASN